MVVIENIVSDSDTILLDTCSLFYGRGVKKKSSNYKFKNLNFWNNNFVSSDKFYVSSLVVEEVFNGRRIDIARISSSYKNEYTKLFDEFYENLIDQLLDFDKFENKMYNNFFSKYSNKVSKRLSEADFDLIVSSFILSKSRGFNSLIFNDRLLSRTFYDFRKEGGFEFSRFYSRRELNSFKSGIIKKGVL